MCTDNSKINHDFALGRQMTVEYYECDSQLLADAVKLEKIFLDAAEKSGAHIISSNFHSFEPQGVSGVVIISESHFTVHAWPEHDYAAVDIFTCGDQIDFELAVQTLRKSLRSRSMTISNALSRGIIGQNGAVVQEKSSESNLEGALSWRKRYESANAWGMLASIDIYDCPEEMLSNGSICDTLLVAANKLKASPVKSMELHPLEQGKGIRFIQMLDSGTINGRCRRENGIFYCDIFLCRFFDPREISETLIDSLKGSYYRLQVALRQ